MRTIRIITIMFTLVSLLSLSGCSQKTAEESISEAKRLMQSGDYETAVIGLKNAVSQETENVEARKMLGIAYVQLGEFESAEKELERSLALGAGELDVAVELIRTKIRLRKPSQVEDIADAMIASRDVSEKAAETLFYAAKFAIENKNNAYAEKIKTYTNTTMPNSRFTKLINAWRQYADSQFEKLDEVLSNLRLESPDLAEVFLLSAFVSSEQNNFEQTKAFSTEYLKFRKYDADVRIHLANSLINLEDIDGAEKQLTILSRANKNDPITNMLLAGIRYEQEDYQKAQELAERSLAINPNISRSAVIAGMSAYQLAKFEQSYSYLSKIADDLPSDHIASRTLQALRLRLGYVDELASRLDPSNSENTNTIASIALSLLQQGEVEKAAEYKKQLEGVELEQSVSLSKRGILKIALDDETGFEDLEAAVKSNPEDSSYRYLLVTEYLGAKQVDNALVAVNNWLSFDKESDVAWFLKGLVHKELNDFDKTLQSFNTALSYNEDNTGALLHLALIEVASKNYPAAQQKFNKVLESKPKNLIAIMHLQEMAKVTNDPSVALLKLTELVELDKSNLAARLGLARALINAGNIESAEQVLAQAPVAQESSPALLSMITELHLRNKEFEQAEQLARKIQQLGSRYSGPLRILIKSLEMQKKYTEALEVARDGTLQFSDEKYFLEMEAYFLALTGQFDEAQKSLNKLPEYPMGEETIEVSKSRGMVALAQGDDSKAIEYYFNIYNSSPNEANALNFANVLHKVGKDAEAIELLKKHSEKNGTSLVTDALMAQIYIDFKPKDAIDLYRDLLNKNQNNPVFLNNLAQAYYNDGNLQEAIVTARQAYAARNDIMLIWDTLGYLLLKNNEIDEALPLLESAHLKTRNLEVTLHYIEALKRAGKNDKADRMLSQITPTSIKLKRKVEELKTI